jgi:AcrR family transcriptional regulator
MKMQREERRQQILEIAWGLCAEKGFSGTTMDDIADGAGVSRALVIQHFGSKEGVYDALWEPMSRAHPLELDPQVRACMETKDDSGVLRACAQHVFEHNLRDAGHSALRLAGFSMLENRELYERFSRVERRAWEGVVSYFKARREEGALRPMDYQQLIEGYKSLVIHLATENMHSEQPPDRDAFYLTIDTMVSSILDGIRS